MRDTATEIYSAFFDVLNGNVTYNGSTIPVYTGMPNNTKGDYIFLEELTQVDWEGADNFGFEETLTIQIVVREKGGSQSRVKLNNLSNQVMQLIKPTVNTEITLTNFSMTGLHLDNSFTDNLLGNTDYYQRKIQTYRYFVSEIQITTGIGAMIIEDTFIVG